LIRSFVAPPADYAWAWALERSASAPLRVQIVRGLSLEARPQPEEDELLLWFGAPDSCDPSLFNYLNEDERARAEKFYFEADRLAYAAAHAGLRALLAPMLGCAPKTLRFAAGANGKPCLDQNEHSAGLHFNISHSRGCVVVAAAGRPVGVDVERRRDNPMIADPFNAQNLDARPWCQP
jgi:4'-phosphopantetheinyl transferase